MILNIRSETDLNQEGKSMKRVVLIMLISLLLLFPASSFSQNLGELRISLLDGDVQIRTEDTDDWVPASINMPLREGDRIWVPDGGRTELQLKDGTYLRLDEKSALEILTLDKDSAQLFLNEGRAYANFKGERGTLLQIDTPLSSSRAYERSIFGVDVTGDGLHQISVLKGSVDTESGDGKTTIRSGYALTLKGETYAELSPLGPPDQWERWNTDRDKRIAEWRPPSRYLPEELNTYSRDFEENGRWVNVREYGYVWTPRVVVSVGWAPYQIGRWTWIGGDYVWISYEPWGWVPYHYGRWAFVGPIGWCWVPPVRGAVFWGPGFVGWVRTPTHVAWVPLAPREIYYGRGYYGPHSVNITQVNVTNIQVNKIVYKNVNVRNGVTVIHHDTFVTGRHVDVKGKENPFLREKISIGGPGIKPDRATARPVIKEIPEKRRPPEPIREIKVKELKERRPFVKERNVSVLKPGAPSKEMTLKVKEGKPVERKFEKPRGSAPAERGIEKPRESRPQEKRIEKPKPVEKGIEKPKESKPQESKPPEKGVEKGKESKPSERAIEKPREIKPQEKGVEKPKESRPAGKETEKQRELKPQEKAVEKPRETRPPEKGIEKPKVFKPEERGVEKPREIKPPEKGVERPKESRPIEKGVEKQRDVQPPARGIEKSRPPEKAVEKSAPIERPKEVKPVDRGAEKPRESKTIERAVEKPREPRPSEKGVQSPRESRPREAEIQGSKERQPAEKGAERVREPKPAEKRIEKPE